tara:strand:- start:322 stop:711 length:390 start_codon:yes stop_codon:yes gene_type:complete
LATIETIQSFLLVSIGAIIGSNLRYKIYKKLTRLKIKKDVIILFINILASFLLGLFYSILIKNNFNYSYQLGLFFSIGFLGSLSTFSTFIYDLFELSYQLKMTRAVNIFCFSLLFGIISLAFGYFLGSI